MGASPRLDVVAGIWLKKEDLLLPDGTAITCGKGHRRADPGWVACPLDGSRFETRNMEKPTDLYARMLAWREEPWVEDEEVDGLHRLSTSSWEYRFQGVVVFGSRLVRTYEKSRVREYADGYLYDPDLPELIALLERASKLCQIVGAPGHPRIYICGSISW